jgi:hypothetical protein
MLAAAVCVVLLFAKLVWKICRYYFMDIDGESEPRSDVPPVLIGNSGDIGWKYGKYYDANNNSKVKCDFCGHISTRGIYRFKQHIASSDNSVRGCKKATPKAIADCKKHFQRVEDTK